MQFDALALLYRGRYFRQLQGQERGELAPNQYSKMATPSMEMAVAKIDEIYFFLSQYKKFFRLFGQPPHFFGLVVEGDFYGLIILQNLSNEWYE